MEDSPFINSLRQQKHVLIPFVTNDFSAGETANWDDLPSHADTSEQLLHSMKEDKLRTIVKDELRDGGLKEGNLHDSKNDRNLQN